MIEFLRQLSDALKPIRYGVDPTHTDFHKSLSQEPNDTTNALVYADWLDEQGQPEHADAVRQHVERFGSGAHRYAYSPEEVTPDQVGRMQATPFEWQGRHRLRLQTFVPSDLIDEYSGKPFLHQLNWVKEYPSEQARLEGARKLKGEGAHLNGWGVAPLGGIREVAEAFAANEKPVRYGAVPEHDVADDYKPTGIAPRVGVALNRIAQDDTDAGLMAEHVLRTGDHSVLKYLADKLADDEHPLKDAFDWRHLERAFRIDKALQGEIERHQIHSHNSETGATQIRPQSAGWTYSDWSTGTRGNLSRRKALEAVRKSVPDANRHDVNHSVLRLLDNQFVRDTSHPDDEGNYSPSYFDRIYPPDARRKAHSDAYLTQLGSPPADPHTYPDTRPPNKRNYAAKYRKSKEWISRKIKKLMGEGKPQKQAVAIALRMAGAPKPDQYAAWKAPVGGLVVKESPLAVSGTFHEGGAFTPDLTKLAAPAPTPTPTPAPPPAKKITLKTLLQRLKGKR